MVVDVQERELLLAQHDEGRVTELEHLGIYKEKHPDRRRTGGVNGRVADGVRPSLVQKSRKKVRHCTDRPNYAESGEDNVPAEQRASKLKARPILHVALHAESKNDVDDSQHWCHVLEAVAPFLEAFDVKVLLN